MEEPQWFLRTACRTDLSPCPTSAAYPVSGTKCQTSRALSYTRANHPPLSRGPAPREKAAPEAAMGVGGWLRESLLAILLLAVAGKFQPDPTDLLVEVGAAKSAA